MLEKGNFVAMLLATVLTLLQLIVWFPSFIRRFCVIQYAKIFKYFGQPVSEKGTLWIDNFTKESCNATFSCVLYVEGDLSIEALTSLFQRTVINATVTKSDGSRVSRYPELKQKLVQFGGTWFWKEDPIFHLKNHIFEVDPTNMADMESVHEFFLNRTLKDGSPWELILVKNIPFISKQTSLLVFRIHHCLSDFKSLSKLLAECLGQKEIKVAQAKLNDMDNIFWRIGKIITYPFNLIETNMLLKQFREATMKHPWSTRPDVVPDIPSKLLVGISEKIPMEEIRSIARLLSVRPSAIIYALFGGAVGLFQKQFLQDAQQMSDFPILCALPMQNHPPHLTNHYYLAFLRLCMDSSQSISERVKRMSQIYDQITSGNLPSCVTFLCSQTASIPSMLTLKFYENLGMSPIALSNLPFDEEGFSIGEGYSCTGFTCCCGFNYGNISLVAFPQSYRDQLLMTLVASSTIINRSEVRTLAYFINQEFSRLKQETIGL